MSQGKKEIDVAWIPTAEAQIGTAQEPLLIQAFLQHRQWLREQKEAAVQTRSLEKIDQVYQNGQQPISCAAGCAACCHARVDISKHEKRLILAHLKTNPVTIDRERLAVQTQALREGTWDQLPFPARQCVFLDKSSRCSIYEARPLLCRRYFVTSDRQHCYAENWSQISRVTNPDADAFLSAVFTKFKFEALPVFLSENLDRL
ncbi:YkgJ family cysteine cluster protein [Oligoflexus tunisiensis]|uniref:YkgJ family cysteine cluster protein n=1 Tax=Oligoflexus tunisiensis TaxID=708132 RepID=UPI00159F030B|nr:YkgJ family cysteine cluster protein [Oligoflexus tunisiensis]